MKVPFLAVFLIVFIPSIVMGNLLVNKVSQITAAISEQKKTTTADARVRRLVDPKDIFPDEPRRRIPEAKPCVKKSAGSNDPDTDKCASIEIKKQYLQQQNKLRKR